jgi:hypothetical protein
MNDNLGPKSSNKFICKICDYSTCKNSQYERHLSTRKHKQMTQNDDLGPIREQTYPCLCGKQYRFRQGLFNHKKSCAVDEPKNVICQKPDTLTTPNAVDSITDTNTILLLLKQNQEFKQLMIEQHAENMVLHKQLINKVNTNTIVNNTTNNNQKFNLNFFLNDTCKDAMSITDFLRNLNVHIDELEYIGNHGYVNGMTKMIMDRLKDMDITKRPIHCTDIKRETMYIKDDAGWSKDTDELTKLRRILSRISMNNYRTVPVWRTAHPDCEVMETRTYEFCYKMMRAILGDVEEEQIKLDNKIIKTLAKELFVQK